MPLMTPGDDGEGRDADVVGGVVVITCMSAAAPRKSLLSKLLCILLSDFQ